MSIRLFKNWWLLGLKGLILFLLGLYTLFNSGEAASGLLLLFGVTFLIGGISEIILALTNRDQEDWGAFLGEGLLDLLIGVLLLSKPGIANVLPILIGIWILFSGISLLGRAIRARRQEWEEGGPSIGISIVLIIIGFLVTVNPFGAYQSLMMFLGVAMVILGLGVMYVSWKLRGMGKTVQRAGETLASRVQDRRAD